ncbi:MAG: ATP-binding protein [Clostridia bacterium]|nr:ATP-binding protein [Clostridia bacterium]
MAAVYLICGKICSGKSTLAKSLAREKSAVILSCDEIMTLFPQPDGDEAYAAVSEKVKSLLLRKAADIIACGANVILDWGFWYKAERAEIAAFFAEKRVPFSWYYLDISDARLRENIACRNAHPGPSDYFVDEGLLQKCLSRFQSPDAEEARSWQVIRCDRQ